MNHRHLPAGQPDMSRRGRYNQHYQQSQMPLYNNYMVPYGGANFYQQHYNPQYHQSMAYAHNYQPYPGYGQSTPPPSMHYAPVPMPAPTYSRPPPVVMTPSYQHPLPPPQTPSSSHSSQTLPGPSTPPTPQTQFSQQSIPQYPPVTKAPFRAPVCIP
jgi:ubiquitin carboxyl-terminal hydrolase 10